MNTIEKKVNDLVYKARTNADFLKKFKQNPKAVLTKILGKDFIANRSVKLHINTESLQHVIIDYNHLQLVSSQFKQLFLKAKKNSKLEADLLSDHGSAAAAKEGVDIPKGVSLKFIKASPKEINFILPIIAQDRDLSDEELKSISAAGLSWTTIGLIVGIGVLATVGMSGAEEASSTNIIDSGRSAQIKAEFGDLADGFEHRFGKY